MNQLERRLRRIEAGEGGQWRAILLNGSEPEDKQIAAWYSARGIARRPTDRICIVECDWMKKRAPA
ncbi:MAG: hypothetical protein ACYC1L_13230 [Alphaproteobacteria bacterium]